MKAVVLEKSGSRCVILKENGEIAAIRDRGYAPGQEIVLKSTFPKKILSLCASFLILIGSALGLYVQRMPADCVYMDINPSLRLDINRFHRVIRIVPLNGDAQTLLNAHDIEGKEVSDCMMEIVDACVADGYINPDNLDIELHVSTGSESVGRAVRNAETAIETEGLEVETFAVAPEDRRIAEEMGVSAGWVRAARRYSEEFGGAWEESTEALRTLSPAEIYSRVRSARKAAYAEKNTARRAFAGSGHEKRLAAIHAYTETFGGTEEENADLLEKLSVKEILVLVQRESDGYVPESGRTENAGNAGGIGIKRERKRKGRLLQGGTTDAPEETPLPTTEQNLPESEMKKGTAGDRTRKNALKRENGRSGGTAEENAVLPEG